eukprot:11157528-Lingulodinium_polyedra.AAC.1
MRYWGIGSRCGWAVTSTKWPSYVASGAYYLGGASCGGNGRSTRLSRRFLEGFEDEVEIEEKTQRPQARSE